MEILNVIESEGGKIYFIRSFIITREMTADQITQIKEAAYNRLILLATLLGFKGDIETLKRSNKYANEHGVQVELIQTSSVIAVIEKV